MATGDLIKLGTLYVNNVKRPLPIRPWYIGQTPVGTSGASDLVDYNSTGGQIEIRDTDADDAYKLRWREIVVAGKKIYVCDRNILRNVSWNDLNSIGLVFGKNITIDNKTVRLRLLTGGTNYRNSSDAYAGGNPADNEWDKYIVNEAGISGLLVPTSTDLDNSKDAADINSAHNKFWNWYYMYSWCQDTYAPSTASRAVRGYNSARWYDYNSASYRYSLIGWRPAFEILNADPSVDLSTQNGQTLYENDTITINGTATDVDNGNVVTVKYTIAESAEKALTAAVSDGSNSIPFNKQLTFRGGKIYDGDLAVTTALTDGNAYTLAVWAEDNQGGKSTVQTRTFHVVPNRIPTLVVNDFDASSCNVDSDKFTISGSCNDLDENEMTIGYRINGGNFTQIYSGKNSEWSFEIMLGQLEPGINSIVIDAIDSYNAKTSQTISLNKNVNAEQLLRSVARYRILPPSKSAKSVLLWIQHDEGLTIDCSLSISDNESAESFVSMTKTNTAIVSSGVLESEFVLETAEAKEKLLLKIDMQRTSIDVNPNIKLISGVLE